MKLCPNCQANVSDAASSCPFCGFSFFPASASPGAGATPTPASSPAGSGIFSRRRAGATPTPAPAGAGAGASTPTAGGTIMGAASPAGSPVSGAASSGFVGSIDFDAWKNYFAIVGGRIEYGLFPQKEASLDASEISRLSLCPKEFASYLHVDGKLYAEFANKYYLVEPIRWKILKREGD